MPEQSQGASPSSILQPDEQPYDNGNWVDKGMVLAIAEHPDFRNILNAYADPNIEDKCVVPSQVAFFAVYALKKWLCHPEQESGWQAIETAPQYRILILWADTSTPDMENWKMATGSKGHDGVWEWDGTRLDKEYHVKPTHWMPLPKPPENARRGSDE